MKTPRLEKAVESGDYSAIQLLEIAATETPSGALRDLLLNTARLLHKQNKQLSRALEVAVIAK